MKDYFLAFDFHNKHMNKFFYGIITIDLNEQALPEVARQVIKDHFHGVNPHEVEVKITAFNNIE